MLSHENDVAVRETPQYRLWFESSSQGVVFHGPGGQLLDANPAAQRILGLTHHELQRFSTGDARWHAAREDGAPLEEHPAMAAMRTGRDVRGVVIRIDHTSDGNHRWILVDAVPLVEPGQATPSLVCEMFSDITDRRAAEEALRESEQLFRVMANTVPQLEWTADGDGNVTWCNDRWYDYTGGTFLEMKGWGWVRWHHPDESARVVEGIRRAIARGELWEDVCRIRNRAGQYHWFLCRAEPLMGDGGRVQRWFATLTDITEQREAEEERERLLTREREAVRSRDHVLSAVSHDLRNPLGTILMASSFLLDTLPSDRAERQQLEMVKRAAGNMNRMIDDLLDITRIESGRLAVERVPTDPKSVLEEVVSLHRPLAVAAQLTLDGQAAENVPLMCADQYRVGQILSNLLGNALKFTPRGGTITVTADALPGAVRWRVSDTGDGIPADELPYPFDRFWQARRGDRRGLGLGLAIVQGLVNAHHGTVDVTSEPGRGTTFTFTIPDTSSGCGREQRDRP